ncbi:MAG: hypothetical protein EOM00_09710 [Clostridia bacterium]|nr:hypothetical protein [Clostridia bacterium]
MEVFGIFGIIALGFSLTLMGLPSKVKKLERQMKKINKNEKGESDMSKMFEELKGKECKITFDSGIQSLKYKVEDLDDEWIKLSSTDKKGVQKIEIVRIEDISKVEI